MITEEEKAGFELSPFLCHVDISYCFMSSSLKENLEAGLGHRKLRLSKLIYVGNCISNRNVDF